MNTERKCYTCDGRGYYYIRKYENIGGRLKMVEAKKKIECPNCTANRKDAVTDPELLKQKGE